MALINFIVYEVLNEPAVLVGLMTFLGLALMRKPVSKVISGTLKSILGFVILGAGANVLIGSLNNLGPMIQQAFDIQGVIPTNEAIVALAQQTFGSETALIMGFGFIANLFFARFTFNYSWSFNFRFCNGTFPGSSRTIYEKNYRWY
jgi:PTS system ascorbate-specific IIC component